MASNRTAPSGLQTLVDVQFFFKLHLEEISFTVQFRLISTQSYVQGELKDDQDNTVVDMNFSCQAYFEKLICNSVCYMQYAGEVVLAAVKVFVKLFQLISHHILLQLQQCVVLK